MLRVSRESFGAFIAVVMQLPRYSERCVLKVYTDYMVEMYPCWLVVCWLLACTRCTALSSMEAIMVVIDEGGVVVH